MRGGLLMLLLSTLVVGGCGYRFASNQRLYPTDIQTVAVPTVVNETFSRSDTAQLTSALVREVEARTPYRLTGTGGADSVLQVTITDVRRRTTSRDRITALPNEQIYVVLADVVWKDLRTGRVLMHLENFEQTAAFYPTLGESDFFASQEAAEQLAAGIVEAMGDDW